MADESLTLEEQKELLHEFEEHELKEMGSPSFLELLSFHRQLDEEFLSHQEAVLSLDINRAIKTLKRYEAQLLTHMQDEEQLLIPIYQTRTGTIPGGGVELFLGEHKKMRVFITEFHEALRGMRAQPESRLKRSIIALMDRQTMYKSLVEHHGLREKNVLYPWLDRVASEEERALLLIQYQGKIFPPAFDA